MRQKRNGNIELLRTVFCTAILLLHTNFVSFGVCGGYLGVEFFFMVTGAYMAKQLRIDKDGNSREPLQITLEESKDSLIGKVKKIYPAFLISTIIGAVVCCFSGNIPYGKWSWMLFANDLLFLQNYGYSVFSATGVVWYLSALFFSQWLIYPIIRRKYDLFVCYIAPVLTLVVYGSLIMAYGTLDVPCTWWHGFVNTGFLRGIAGITCGAFCYEMSVRIRCSTKNAKVLGAIEGGVYALVFTYIFFKNRTENTYGADGTIVILMALGLTITLSESSILHRKFDYSFVYACGKFSTVFFLNHYYWVTEITAVLERMRISIAEPTAKLLAIGLSVATTLLVQWGENCLRKSGAKE